MLAKLKLPYKGYTLFCDTFSSGNRRFGAKVLINDPKGASVRGLRYPDFDAFHTEQDAADAALEWAKYTVDALI